MIGQNFQIEEGLKKNFRNGGRNENLGAPEKSFGGFVD